MLNIIWFLNTVEMLREERLFLLHLARHALCELQPLFHGVARIDPAGQLLTGELVGVLVGLIASLLVPGVLQQALKCHEVNESRRVHKLILMNERCLCRYRFLDLVGILHC